MQHSDNQRNEDLKDSDGQITPQQFVFLEATRIDQHGRTLRTAIISVSVLIGLGIVCFTVSQCVKTTPVWVQIATLLFGAGGPAAAIFGWIKKLKGTVSRLSEQKNKIESLVDPHRSTSNLNKDGTSHDD